MQPVNKIKYSKTGRVQKFEPFVLCETFQILKNAWHYNQRDLILLLVSANSLWLNLEKQKDILQLVKKKDTKWTLFLYVTWDVKRKLHINHNFIINIKIYMYICILLVWWLLCNIYIKNSFKTKYLCV